MLTKIQVQTNQGSCYFILDVIWVIWKSVQYRILTRLEFQNLGKIDRGSVENLPGVAL